MKAQKAVEPKKLEKADSTTKKSEFLTIAKIGQVETPFGAQLAYLSKDVVKGRSLRSFDPTSLLISIPNVTSHRGWASHWLRKFDIDSQRIRVLLGTGYSVCAYVPFARVLEAENTPEWQSLNRELKQQQIDSDREHTEFQRVYAAHKRDIAIISGKTATKQGCLNKAQALRRAADYPHVGQTMSSWDVRANTGLTDKQLKVEVDAGSLIRKRSVGWKYQSAGVRALMLRLAADIERKAKAA